MRNDRRLKKLERAIIEDIFYKNLTFNELRCRYDLDMTRTEYGKIVKFALTHGKITRKQNKERISRTRGHRLKVDKETIRKITHDVFDNHMIKPEVCGKYGISRSVFVRAMNLSVGYGFTTKEQISLYRSTAHIRGHEQAIKNLGTKVLEETKSQYSGSDEEREALIRKLGEDELYRRFHAGHSEWVGLHIDAVKENAKKGGQETQRRHGKKVRGNLKGGESYGKHPCYYGELEFHSDGERFTGLILVELGLIPEIIVNENFHKHINGKTEVDFYINDKLIVEYHPVVKKHSGIESLTDGEYTSHRTEQLNGTFNGVVINITKTTVSEYYDKLKLVQRMTFSEFMEKYHAVGDKIKKHDEFFKEEDGQGEQPEEPAF